MGAYLSEPVTTKHIETGSVQEKSCPVNEYAACAMQGWRKHQEDAHVCPRIVSKEGGCNVVLAGVYDGHGGAEVARYVAAHLSTILKALPEYKSGMYEKALQTAYLRLDDMMKSSKAQFELKQFESDAERDERADLKIMMAKRKARKSKDTKAERGSNVSAIDAGKSGQDSGGPMKISKEVLDELNNSGELEKKILSIIEANQKNGGEIEFDTDSEEDSDESFEQESSQAMSPGMPIDEKNATTNPASPADGIHEAAGDLNHPDAYGVHSGCTATSVLIVGDNKLICANSGDSRCVLCRKGVAVPLSRDHNPDQQDEYDRIYKAGGMVNEEGRVEGNLNLSRAIGDLFYKSNTSIAPEEQMITANPEIQTIDLCLDDEFLIIACDGIWNVMDNQEVVDFVRRKIAEGKTLGEISGALCDVCLSAGVDGDGTGCDNETVVLMTLSPDKNVVGQMIQKSSPPRVVSGGPGNILKRSSSSDEFNQKTKKSTIN